MLGADSASEADPNWLFGMVYQLLAIPYSIAALPYYHSMHGIKRTTRKLISTRPYPLRQNQRVLGSNA